MAIVIVMNRAGKRAWAQRIRGCRMVAARVGCAPSTAPRVVHPYLQEGEAGLWDHRQANGCRTVSGTVTEALRHLIASTPPPNG